MKKTKNIYKFFIMLFLVVACDEELRDISFANNIAPPSNVAAAYDITQDNTGDVTITPSADGAVSYKVNFGDSSTPATIGQGESVMHTYAEGSYDVVIEASNLNGDKTEEVQPLVVSFKAPENVVATIENDAALTKQVNVTTTADFATMYEFHSGETGVTQPVATANIGESLSYTYANAGTYSIKIIVKGGAIQTTEYTEDFEVTEILAPIASAPIQPSRLDTDVISVFSDVYTDVAGTDFYPNWGQNTQFTAFDLNGDAILQYSNLNYQGINIGSEIDASGMEMLHIDIWTADATSIDIYPLPNGVVPADEKFVTKALVADQWNSFDIPLSDFTGQGLPIDKLLQFKFVGSGTVFMDNIYFYKEPTGIVTTTIQDFETNVPSFDVFGNIAAIEVIDNPDATGVNTTTKVAKMTKTAGSEVWAGSFFDVTTPLDLVNHSKMSIKTWSPKTGATIRLKIENSANNQEFFEVDATTTKSNEWEELSFDLSSAQAFTYDRIVIFFDFGNAGDDSVYYYDEFNLVDDSGNSVNIFQDFETTVPSFDVFGNIAAIEVIDNPDATGANTTTKVAKMTKTAGSEVWAGSFFDIDPALDLVNYTTMSIKTWSPKSGATVRLKIENSADNQQFFEIDATTSTANSWEELTFDLSTAQSFNYDRIVIFFDFGNAGDDSIYYYDEFGLTN
jgi:hypothetical protein